MVTEAELRRRLAQYFDSIAEHATRAAACARGEKQLFKPGGGTEHWIWPVHEGMVGIRSILADLVDRELWGDALYQILTDARDGDGPPLESGSPLDRGVRVKDEVDTDGN